LLPVHLDFTMSAEVSLARLQLSPDGRRVVPELLAAQMDDQHLRFADYELAAALPRLQKPEGARPAHSLVVRCRSGTEDGTGACSVRRRESGCLV